MDARAFHARDRRFHFVARTKQNQVGSRCAPAAGLGYPQFNKDALIHSLGQTGIRYEHFPELDGRRKPTPDSRNTAWRNEAFRDYADHMEGKEFRPGIARLLDLANDVGRTAIMCAEAVWWRCHRALVADFLKTGGVEVLHILGEKRIEPHPFTSAARLVNGALKYTAIA